MRPLKVTIPIPVIRSIVLLVAFLLPLLYLIIPDYQDLIVFLASCLGAAGAIISAVYIGWGLKERKESDRIQLSYEYLKRYNDPSFFEIKKEFRILMGKIKDSKGTNRTAVVKGLINNDVNKEAYILEMLNFYEEIAIAIQKRGADEQILMDGFKTLIEKSYQLLGPWIEYRRSEKGNRIFKALEELHKNWGKS